jgi:tRNA pseudouridine55 synthase
LPRIHPERPGDEARSPKPSSLNGLVLVDKPVGPSSFDIVKRLRGRYGVKAGHAGTLDPLASGLLLCLLGPSTRLARYLVGLDKRYSTEIRLGLRTTTGDGEGAVLEETEIASPGEIEALEGEVELVVPRASAVKIEGERAYKLHRRGVAVEMPIRRSTIHALQVRHYDPPLAELVLHVSSGTYVRAIADVLGGHCRTIRRTAVGPFRVEDADEERVLLPLAALVHLPERGLSDEEVALVRTGRAIEGGGEGAVALWDETGLVAVGLAGGGVIRPETVLPPA